MHDSTRGKQGRSKLDGKLRFNSRLQDLIYRRNVRFVGADITNAC